LKRPRWRSCRPLRDTREVSEREFHDYESIERATGVKFYFATPYHSWERGTNENANGLIRQYLPKRTRMARATQADCDRIAMKLNTRPRKRYAFRTPKELFDAA
jgi:IS30 family transposase